MNHAMMTKQGIQYLVETGLIEYSPESIARFIKDHGEELDKEQIGEYFAKGHVFLTLVSWAWPLKLKWSAYFPDT